jgi:hypothetical protein
MKKEDALTLARRELQRHTLATFNESAPATSSGIIVVPGCPHCKIRLNTVDQLMRHLSEDVMPGIVDLILGGGREPGMEGQ